MGVPCGKAKMNDQGWNLETQSANLAELLWVSGVWRYEENCENGRRLREGRGHVISTRPGRSKRDAWMGLQGGAIFSAKLAGPHVHHVTKLTTPYSRHWGKLYFLYLLLKLNFAHCTHGYTLSRQLYTFISNTHRIQSPLFICWKAVLMVPSDSR